MLTIGDLLFQTDFESIAREFEVHYNHKHIERLREIYLKLKNTPAEQNMYNMVVFIRAIKENEEGDEDVVVEEFDNDDTSIMFDVAGKDNQYDGLYSIASSAQGEILSYYLDQDTLNKFSYAQILAHILWELLWAVLFTEV